MSIRMKKPLTWKQWRIASTSKANWAEIMKYPPNYFIYFMLQTIFLANGSQEVFMGVMNVAVGEFNSQYVAKWS